MGYLDDLWEQASPSSNDEDLDSLWASANADEATTTGPGVPVRTPQEGELQGMDQFTNLMKQGLARGTAMIGEASKVLPLTAAPTAITNFITGEQVTPDIPQALSKWNERIGAKETPEPRDITARITEEMVRALGDPTSYMFGGPLKGGVTAVGKEFAKRGLLSSASMPASVIGGEVGKQAEKAAFGTESGAGELIGAMGAPVASTATLGVPATIAAKKVAEGTKKIAGIRKDPTDFLSGKEKSFLNIVQEEMGPDEIDKAVKRFADIKGTITGVDTPLAISMVESPAVAARIKSLVTSSSPEGLEMRSRLTAELNSVRGKLEADATKAFGERFTDIGVPKVDQSKLANLQVRQQSIDSQLSKLTDKYSRMENVSRESIGNQIENLVEAKKSAVIQEMVPEYQALEDAALASKAKLDKSQTQRIYDTAVSYKIDDLFGKEHQIYKLIKGSFAPVRKDQSAMEIAVSGREPAIFKDVPFKDIKSLKERIGETLRSGSLSKKQRFALNELYTVVKGARDEGLPQDISKAWADLDLAYYNKVGVPFDANGIKDIDSKKYAELVSKVLTNNGSAARQFLDVAGDEGKNVMRNAILSEIYHRPGMMDGGAINPTKLAAFIKQKGEVLDNLPELKQELMNDKNIGSKIVDIKTKLNELAAIEEKRISDNVFTKLRGEVPNYTQMANDIMRNRSTFINMFGKDGQLSMLDAPTRAAVTNNIRREILENMHNSPQGAVSYMTDPNNAYVINKLFGQGYGKKIENIAYLSDVLRKSDPEKLGINVKTENLDPLSQLTGLNTSETISTIRRPIISPFQKGVVLLSKFFTNNIKSKEDKMFVNLLLDKDGLDKLSKVSEQVKKNGLTKGAVDDLRKAMEYTLPARALVGAESTTGNEEQVQETPPVSYMRGGFAY